MNNFGEKVSVIWSVAELLRGPYRPNQYKDVMLPLTVLRRLDCVLEPTKEKVLERLKKLKGTKVKNVEPILCRVSGVPFYNTSRYTFERLKGDPNNVAANLTNYIKGFSSRAREIIEHFGFEEHIAKLDKADRLYLIVSKFCEIDLHPDRVSNIEMGYIFEELIRRFNEASNEEAGDHFTPREVIRLMVNLLFLPDGDVLTTKGIVKTLYDPACGTGGMLSVAEEYVRELNPDACLEVFGQDFNPQAYAICGSDMMIKGQDIEHIAFGDSFTDDRFPDKKFDYMLANPPFGVEWKPEADLIKREHEEQGFDTLIEKKERQIELLQEKRTALISHAVTKGLDPNVKMKDSGVEWLGRIPEHWECANIRRFATMKTGHTPSRRHPEYWTDCRIPWFTLTDVWQLRDGKQKYLGQTKEKISELGLQNSAAELLPAGTVVFSRTASIGFAGIMPIPMATSQDFWNWICGPRLLPDYLLYLFRAMSQEFEALTMGSTHKTIYQPIAAALSICVPPMEEQREIVAYVEGAVVGIDSLSGKVQESIDLLREYRTALISAAVTGKIDVRSASEGSQRQ